MQTLAGWLFCLLCASCAMDQHFEFPQGPQGEQGPPGPKGLSAYQVWLEQIQNDPTYEGGYDPADFFLYLKGDKGEDADLGDITLPEDGKSAYELWVESLERGDVLEHYLYPDGWPAYLDSEPDFWLFLTGAQGNNGNSGDNSYQLWVKYIADGTVKDPHDPDGEDLWSATRNREVDFWYFFIGDDGTNGTNGTNGLTAYQLWKADVLDTDGLAHPKYPNTDVKWPKNQVDLEDFWEYLKGMDGKNGATFTILDGYYNVIPLFTQEPYGELVNVNDGSVKFKVYDKNGDPLANAKITQMPGIDYNAYYEKYGEELVFTSGPDGTFTVDRKCLPHDVDDEYQYGTAFVWADGQPEGETSAGTTYVPERMDIRLRLRGAVTLAGGLTQYPVIVERRQDAEGSWSIIPDYLEGRSFSQPVKFYKVADQNAPAIPAITSWGSLNIDVKNPSTGFGLSRPKVAHPCFEDVWEKSTSSLYDNIWDGIDAQYFVAQLESYYGTPAQLMDETGTKPVVSIRVPIQRAPIIKDVKMSEKTTHPTEGYPRFVMSTQGSFDTNYIEYKYFYNTTLTEVPVGSTHVYIHPTVMDETAVNAVPLLQARFQKVFSGPGATTETATALSQAVTLADPNWSISSNVFDTADAAVVLPTAARNLFYGSSVVELINFGTVSFDENEINNRDASVYSMPDINVTFAQ